MPDSSAQLRRDHRQPAQPDDPGARPAAGDALRLRRAEHAPLRARHLHPQVPEGHQPAEAGDPGQGRDAAHHRLPARAHLPAPRRQLLRLRGQRPRGQPLPDAFVLKTFAQAKGLIYIDETVLADAAAWIALAPERRRLVRGRRLRPPQRAAGRRPRQGRPHRLRRHRA